jgi:dienelactone hydrolase
MSTLVLTVSGHSGGTGGPQGIYQQFSSCWKDKSVTVINVDTIPDSVEENVARVFQIAQERSNSYDKIYLVGHSMGGAVVAQVARNMKLAGNHRVAGVALLSTQTDGLQALKDIDTPVLFYHGSEDGYFPIWQMESSFRACKGQKKFVQVDGLGHDLSRAKDSYVSEHFVRNLAKDVIAEMSSFFNAEEAQQGLGKDRIVTKKIPLRALDRFINLMIRLFHSFSSCKCKPDDPLEESLDSPEASQLDSPNKSYQNEPICFEPSAGS